MYVLYNCTIVQCTGKNGNKLFQKSCASPRHRLLRVPRVRRRADTRHDREPANQHVPYRLLISEYSRKRVWPFNVAMVAE